MYSWFYRPVRGDTMSGHEKTRGLGELGRPVFQHFAWSFGVAARPFGQRYWTVVGFPSDKQGESLC